MVRWEDMVDDGCNDLNVLRERFRAYLRKDGASAESAKTTETFGPQAVRELLEAVLAGNVASWDLADLARRIRESEKKR